MDIKTLRQVLWNRRWAVAIVLAVGIVLAVIADARARTSYTATSSVLMVPGSGNENAAPTTSTKPLLSDDLPLLVQTSSVLDEVSRDLGGMSQDTLQHNVRAVVYTNSNVMTIRFSAHDRKLAVKGANAVAFEVVRYYRTIATSRFDSLANDLRRQLAHRQAELQQIDVELQQLTAAYPYIQFGTGATDGTSINAVLVHLQGQRDDMAAAMSGDAAQAAITDERISEATPLARRELANANPFYRSVQEQYGRDAAQLRRIQTQYAPNYPGLPELQDIVSRERAGISGDERSIAAAQLSGSQAYAAALAERNHARGLLASDVAKLQRIDGTIAALQKELRDAGSTGPKVAALRRERDSAESAYQLLSNRLMTVLTDRAAAASTGSLTLFDRASFAAPSPYTQPLLITSAIMIVAAWIAITLAFGLEAMDRRFRTPGSIENVYGSPVLGVI